MQLSKVLKPGTDTEVAADAWCAPGGPRSGLVETVPASPTGSDSQPGHGRAVPQIPPFRTFCVVPTPTTPKRA